MTPTSWLLLALAALFALLWLRARGRVGRGNAARAAAAREAEDAAVALLAHHGYHVDARQVTAAWTLLVDGEAVEVTCRADLRARRKGRVYVAEVKTGPHASDPTWPATRRQLLEYLHAFDVDGVLLVDMHRGEIRRVDGVGDP